MDRRDKITMGICILVVLVATFVMLGVREQAQVVTITITAQTHTA